MEIHTRRHHTIQDQENIYAVKGKGNLVLPVKRQGLGVRGALGDVNTNVQAQRDVGVGKVAVATAEFEKKATQYRAPLKSNYGHVTSKVDTGLAVKNVPSARPPLRREESTASLAAKAVARTRAALKESLWFGCLVLDSKQDSQTKETLSTQPSKSSNSLLQAKKATQETKKTIKVPKEQTKGKENKETSKTLIKDPIESLGKLKLADTKHSEKIINDSVSSIIQLPDDIEDIDASDKNSPLLMSIYIKDIYKYLTELEIVFPIEEDHLKKQNVITGKMRATLIDWLVEVQRQFSLVLETFHLTVGIIDRYLQIVPNVQRDRLQLIGVTAMYIASKYEEIYAPDVGDFVYVTANAYSKADVFQCERDILAKLGFCLARPIPLSFLRRFVKAAHGTSKHHHLAKYLVDLCLVEYAMAHHRPSELAAAAICLSLHLLSNKPLDEVWTPTLSYYSEYTLEHIEPIISKIAKVVTNVENCKCKAVYNKYLDVTLAKVSSLPQLKGETVYKLANSHTDC